MLPDGKSLFTGGKAQYFRIKMEIHALQHILSIVLYHL